MSSIRQGAVRHTAVEVETTGGEKEGEHGQVAQDVQLPEAMGNSIGVLGDETRPQGADGDQHRWDLHTFVKIVTDVLRENGSLSDEQRRQLLAVVIRRRTLWTKTQLGEVDLVYNIEVPPEQNPIRTGDRRWSLKEIELIKREVESLLDKRYIEPARSPWSSRLVLVTKKDGSVRVCVDYRRLNDITITDAYPTPRVDNVIQALSGSDFFTTLDCEKGYYQVKISEHTKQVTALTCPVGQFRWTRLPFGLKNAPAVFQRLMDIILAYLTWKSCMVFFDDVVVFSDSWEGHLVELDQVFGRLEASL
jgi:hypothetical protein